ncbi:MAG: YfiR family protein [Verrucomicrobiota bacterium]
MDGCGPGWWRVADSLVLLLAWWGLLVTSHATTPPGRSEYELKAAFLHKFAMFVEWPVQSFDTTNAPIVIGILGRDPFGPKLEAVLASKRVHGRAVEFQRFARVEDVLLARCQMLFIASSEQARLPAILEAIKTVPLLTVGDSPGYGETGVMINLVVREQSLRFEINRQSAVRVGLQVSSQLLELALPTRERPQSRSQ